MTIIYVIIATASLLCFLFKINIFIKTDIFTLDLRLLLVRKLDNV